MTLTAALVGVFLENATGGVQLTVKATDYEVTMSRCGAWVPAK